jgi:hypothetical protein
MMYRAIAISTAFGSFRSALIASALRFFSYAILVFSLLPFPSRCRSKASILGSCWMYWAGSSVRIAESVSMWLVVGEMWLGLDRAPAS